MRLIRNEYVTSLKYQSMQLLNKMLSPLCGINQEIGYITRTVGDSSLIVGSAALTGVHVLMNRPDPGRGAYHIGGTGFLPNESMIRILGETIERSAQLMSDFSFSNHIKFARYNEFEDQKILPESFLHLYSEAQLLRANFPFNPYAKDQPLGWIRMYSLFDNSPIWIPAQFVLVGYNIRKNEHEPWLTAAVTTGTASHINYSKALRAAILELIQLDSVMGHWYSKNKAYRIEFDDRLSSLSSLIKRTFSSSHHQYQFYFLPNPDLAGFSVACVYLQKKGLPKVVIGLGADMTLEDAMYKAFLETVASIGLARMVVFKGKFEISKHNTIIDPKHLYDLDRNVEYYSLGKNFERIEERFLKMSSVKAKELPTDITGNINEQLQKLITSFQSSNKNLYFLDLSREDEKTLGFKSVRVWSPDTLSLCLPSAPQILHPRFNDYGGIKHDDPHPYP